MPSGWWPSLASVCAQRFAGLRCARRRLNVQAISQDRPLREAACRTGAAAPDQGGAAKDSEPTRNETQAP